MLTPSLRDRFTVKRIVSYLQTHRKIALLLAIFFLTGAGIAVNTVTGVLTNMKKASQPDNTPQWFPDYPPLRPATSQSLTGTIARGELLVKAGDCMACHTDTHNKGASFAGGLPMQTPFGVIYSPNITPDPDTGIGRWSEAQFIRAMQKGISPQGHYYYPAFPYLYFSRMPIEDLKAIKAYLDAIPAVHQLNRDNEMVFPFNLRIMQLPWHTLLHHIFHSGFEFRIRAGGAGAAHWVTCTSCDHIQVGVQKTCLSRFGEGSRITWDWCMIKT